MPSSVKIQAIKTRVFKVNENLLKFLEFYFKKLKEGDVLVITSKIVSLSENRFLSQTSLKIKEKLIRQESDFVLKTKLAFLTIKNGVAMANAGVDESNANGGIILLPDDSFKTAVKIRSHFQKKYKLKKLGVIVTDSRTMPLRSGIVGIALGYAGFKGLKDYRQTKDIFNRPFHFSRVDVADSLATAAVFCMGEGNEQKPLAIIRGASLEYVNKIMKNDLNINIKKDMYAPLFRKIK